MSKIEKTCWKAGNMVYPLPAVLVSCGNEKEQNIVTVAWTGTICTNPAMTYISLRPSRFSYDMIKESGYFTINLTTEKLLRATDYCGVRSGRDIDKFKEMNLTCSRDEETQCPMILESPVSVLCEVSEIKELGSHHMFIAYVKKVYVDETYLNDKGKFELNDTGLIAYSHGSYLSLGKELGTFGYSVRKKKKTIKKEVPVNKDITIKDTYKKSNSKKDNYKKSKSKSKAFKNKVKSHKKGV